MRGLHSSDADNRTSVNGKGNSERYREGMAYTVDGPMEEGCASVELGLSHQRNVAHKTRLIRVACMAEVCHTEWVEAHNVLGQYMRPVEAWN